MREGNKFERVIDAARAFVNLSNPDDEFFLTLFSDTMSVEQDITKGREPILKTIADLKAPTGTTLLYDTVYSMADKLNRYETPNHKALILITDGDDTSSHRADTDVIKYVGSTNVQVYSIGIFGSDYVPTAKRFLFAISEGSGGKAFFPGNSKGLAKIWSEIADELRHQYGIAYAPSNNRSDGSWRQIDVRVKKPDGFPNLKIRTRKGYFATYEK
jgi:VWFA-related protein